MLLVKTKLLLSQIHGIGLFADENIPEGTKIWEWIDGVDFIVKKEVVNKMTDIQKEFMRIYPWVDENGDYWCCGDNDRFANHSDNPNCISKFINGLWLDVAVKNIKKGEEITYNYWSFHKGKEL